MEAIEALHNRVSSPRLTGSVSQEHLDVILKAGLRAPDHAQLKPWRFLVISGGGRKRLGELFARAKLTNDPDSAPAEIDKVKGKTMRAPTIIVGIASVKEHPKVPASEQVISAGAALQSMSLAAYALGLGAMWRTGSMAYDRVVSEGLGLTVNEQIVGYLYLGEVEGRLKTVNPLPLEDFVAEWR